MPLLVNGPYIVGAHERSLGSPSLALANWVNTHLPEGSQVAVDRDNAGLLNDFGQVDPVTPLNGSANPATLFFDPQLTPSDIALIRKDHIRYIVTDTRLTEALPLFGAYIAPGETGQPTRLTAAELEKFNSIPGVYRIYDNGVIQVYDLSVFLGEHPLAVPKYSVHSIRTTGTDVVVLVLALLVAIVWLLRLRRRARHVPINEHLVVCGIVGVLAAGVFGTFAILRIHLPPGPVAILVLLRLAGAGPVACAVEDASQAQPRAPRGIGGDGCRRNPDGQHRSVPGAAAPTARAALFVPVPSSCWGAWGWHSLRLEPQLPWPQRKGNGCLLLSSPSREGRGRPGGRSLAWISARPLRPRPTSR